MESNVLPMCRQERLNPIYSEEEGPTNARNIYKARRRRGGVGRDGAKRSITVSDSEIFFGKLAFEKTGRGGSCCIASRFTAKA